MASVDSSLSSRQRRRESGVEAVTITPEDEKNVRKTKYRSLPSWCKPSVWLPLVGISLLWILHRLLPRLLFYKVVTLFPVYLSLYAAVRPDKSFAERVMPTALVLAVVSNQFPTFLGTALAALSIVAFSCITDPRHRTPAIQKVGASFGQVFGRTMLLIASLLAENFLVWVVSATFAPGQNARTAPLPLQDNGKILVHLVFRGLTRTQVVGMRRLWNAQWALVTSLAAAFLQIDVFHQSRTLFSVGSRAVTTLALARLIRCLCFSLTVLPNQMKHCYNQRFPNPPPTEWWEFIRVGLSPRSNGGCNDLIVSGHATVTGTLACVATSVTDDGLFATALWSLVVLDYVVEVYEGYHYSVDMLLGVVIVVLIWKAMETMETQYERRSPIPVTKMTQAFVLPKLSRLLFMAKDYFVPAVVVYLQLNVWPESVANYVILSFVAWLGLIWAWRVRRNPNESSRRLSMHNMQHVLLCLLLLAFGIYL